MQKMIFEALIRNFASENPRVWHPNNCLRACLFNFSAPWRFEFFLISLSMFFLISGNALDDLNLDEPLNLVATLDRDFETDSTSVNNSISAGLASSGKRYNHSVETIQYSFKRWILSKLGLEKRRKNLFHLRNWLFLQGYSSFSIPFLLLCKLWPQLLLKDWVSWLTGNI